MEETLKANVQKINKVYRFFSDEEHNFQGLAESYLWFSEIDKFNDPFEVVINSEDFDFRQLSSAQLKAFLLSNKGITFGDPDTDNSYVIGDFSDEELGRFVVEQYHVLVNALNVIVLEIIKQKQNNKFHCLVHDANIKPLESRLMWSHYSNGLRGFVIEFDFDPVLTSIAHKSNDDFGGYTLINYTELGFTDYIKSVIDSGKPLFADRMLFSKHIDWKYENELRLICSNEKVFYDSSCISRIIIGQKMLPEKMNDLMRLLKSKGLQSKTYITCFDRQDFSINIKPYGDRV
ncbi:DUF2971 domain-containing protein [Aliivibrio sifiae]|uniref:DUF2971 domain-containing protein n=1 Tax=Aliivibrio sifiae TaxID=566293 RepID=UPI003D14634E